MKDITERARNRNSEAFATFRAVARKMAPTKQHRAAIWENMLGTVYAMNKAGETRYFDYDYAAAVAFVGPVQDVRVARYRPYRMRLYPVGLLNVIDDVDYQLPRAGQFVWFARDYVEETATR